MEKGIDKHQIPTLETPPVFFGVCCLFRRQFFWWG